MVLESSTISRSSLRLFSFVNFDKRILFYCYLLAVYICRMEELLQQIQSYRDEIEAIKISNAQELEDYRIKYLGTKGIVKNLFGEMKSVPAEKKKEFGLVLNDFKLLAETKYETAKESASNGQNHCALRSIMYCWP